LVQPNAAQRDKWDPDKAPLIFERALDLTRAPSDAPIALTIWPETSLPDILNYADDLTAQVTEAAGLSPVVIGANRFEGPRLYNSAVLLNAQGEALSIYDKHHLVPFGEYLPFGELFKRFGYYGMAASEGRGFSAGEGALTMDLGALGRALPLICYEVVFPQDVRSGSERPDMLMQITNDAWFGDFSGPYQHLVQAQMRSLEMGLPMVRAANTGVSAKIDARGRIIAQLPLNEAGYLDVKRQDPLPQTLYAWVGDAPVLAFLLLGLLGYAATRPREFA
jgi:apolipoprotein N-acyltransferase